MPADAAPAELGCRIEAGLAAQHRLSTGAVDEPLAGDLLAISAAGRAAAEQLVQDHLPLVDALAAGFAGRGLESADVIQEGRLGLVSAVAAFDYTVDRFAEVAAWWIRRSILQAIHDAGRDALPTTRAAAELGMSGRRADRLAGGPPELVSLDAPSEPADPHQAAAEEPMAARLYDPDDPATEALALAALDSAALDSAVTGLGDPAATVLQVRFGLGPGPSMTLEAASRATGLRPEQIRQYEAQAIRRLREYGGARLLA